MKNLSLTLLVVLTGCNGASVDLGNVFESTAGAGVPSCSPGMTLIPAQVGSAAFCIDDEPQAAQNHINTVTTCADQGKNLCSFQETQVACLGGHVIASDSFTSAVSWTGASMSALTVKPDCTRGGPTGLPTTTLRISFCCTR